jgi:cyclophilin family peptidyl-prolyl cis-trans isomerase/HEAT repeat protein
MRAGLVLAAAATLAAAGAWAAAPRPAHDALLRAIAEVEDRRDGTGGTLTSALAHADPVVRARATLAVGRLQDSLTVPALVPLVADPAGTVRREAVFALGQVGHRSARATLEGALRDRDPEVVALALEALGKLGDGAATASLVPFLRRGTAAQKMRACESLWRLADSSGLGPLLAALGERDPAVRWRVIYALEKLPAPERIVPAVAPALHDRDPLVRAHAARTLGRERSPLATSALLAALDDVDPAVIVNAVRALQQVADGSVRPGRRLGRLLAHRDPHVRVTAASALADSFAWVGSADDTLALRAVLRQGMQDSDFATRGACGRALITRLRLAGLDLARPLFSDTIAYVRTAVLEGLRVLRAEDLGGTPPRAVNALSGAFHTGNHQLVKMTAADVAGSLIGRTRHPAFQPLLAAFRQGVDARDMLLAAACASALGEAGDTVSVPRLAAAYAARGHDADADARIAIRDALRSLAGRAFADSVERAHPSPAPPASGDSAFHATPRARGAILHTSVGTMEWAFFTREAPQTVRNFVTLAQRGYFDSLWVHRVVPDFVIQDGDPSGTGSGGPGYTIRCEYNPLRYEAGMVGMALSGKDTGGSQWFVTLSPQPHLNGRYTIFARVVRGLEVARQVTQGARVHRVTILP